MLSEHEVVTLLFVVDFSFDYSVQLSRETAYAEDPGRCTRDVSEVQDKEDCLVRGLLAAQALW